MFSIACLRSKKCNILSIRGKIMGEFSNLAGLRSDYYEYTDEVAKILKAETTSINEAFLADELKDKILDALDNEYPLSSLLILRITHREIVELITDKTNVNIRRDVCNKIVTRITGKSAIMAHYSGDSDDVKRRRAMMNMINNYMQSMYMSTSESNIPMMEKGLLKALSSFKNEEQCVKSIDISSANNPQLNQGIVFTITITIES